MSEIIYLKKEIHNNILASAKITDEYTLSIHTQDITISNNNKELFLNMGYIDATKQEFDAFTIKVVGNINKLMSL